MYIHIYTQIGVSVIHIWKHGILSYFNLTLGRMEEKLLRFKTCGRILDGLWLLRFGQLSDSAELYYEKGQMIQIVSHRKAFIARCSH